MPAIILVAINDMKTGFSTTFDGVLSAIENIRKDITDFNERITEKEIRISTTEDNVAALQQKSKASIVKVDLEEKALAERREMTCVLFLRMAAGHPGAATRTHQTHIGADTQNWTKETEQILTPHADNELSLL